MVRRAALDALTWVGVQADRVWRLLPDLWRVVRGGAGTMRWLILPARPRPCLAALEGESVARPGVPNAYRLRVHNPTDAPHPLRVVIRGWTDRGDAPSFTIEWHATVAARGSLEQWIRSSWRGDASLLDRAPRDPTLPSAAGDSTGRWTVEASVAHGRSRDWLRIGGTLVR